MHQKSKGGARPGAGRKPSATKKRPMTLYIEDTSIQKWGGWEELKRKLHDFIAFPNQFDPQFVKFPIEFPPKEAERPLLFKKPSHKVGNKAKEPDMDKPIEFVQPTPEAYNGPKFDQPKTIVHATTFDEKGNIVQDLKIQQLSKPEVDRDAISKQIAAIRAESCPKERDTPLGRKSWQIEQKKRIEALENQSK